MDSLAIRCRHKQVEWVGPNRCKCSGCSKFGHWFKEAGLVMWFRGVEQTNSSCVEDQPVDLELQAS